MSTGKYQFYNAKGTKGNKKPTEGWIEWWEGKTSKKVTSCLKKWCGETESLDGAHIHKKKCGPAKDKAVMYIIILCSTCNNPNNKKKMFANEGLGIDPRVKAPSGQFCTCKKSEFN